MNKHIELVKKWLVYPDSVTQKELEENADAAGRLWNPYLYGAWAARCADHYAATYMVAYYAAYWAAEGFVERAKYWVERYEESVK